jgi:cysteine dioxygenase
VYFQLVADFLARGPLDRSPSEVEALLYASSRQWPSSSALACREGGYARICAYQDPRFEVLLLNWAPGAVSPIHDHGDQHCWMYLLEGRLEVDDYVRLDPGDIPGYAHVEQVGSRRLEVGELDSRVGRYDLHRVSSGDSPALSLHVYAAPLRQFGIYDEPSRRCETSYGRYDAVLHANAQGAPR